MLPTWFLFAVFVVTVAWQLLGRLLFLIVCYFADALYRRIFDR